MPVGEHHYDKDNKDDGSGMAPRSCTDILCALIFFAFMGGMGYVVQYGVTNGVPQRLTHGFNYNGELCGVDPAVKTRPLLYWCPTMSAIPGIPTGLNLKAPVCVDHCPVDDTETMTCMQQTQAAVGPGADSGAQTVVLAQSTVQLQSYPTNEVMGLYCIPDLQKLNAIASASGIPVPGGLRESLLNSAGPIGKNSVKAQQYIGSLRRCSSLLGGSLLIAVVLGYAYLFALKMCAKPLIYTSLAVIVFSCFAVSGFFIIGEMMPRPSALNDGNAAAPPLSVTGAAPTGVAAAPVAPIPPIAATGPAVATGPAAGALGVAAAAAPALVPPVAPDPNTVSRRMTMTYEQACQQKPESCAALEARWNQFGGRKKWEGMNPFYSEHLTLENAKQASMVTSGVFAVIGLIFVILICCAAKAINTATGCVEAATDALFSMPCMLLMPAVEIIIKAILMSVLLVFLAYLVSAGTMDTKTYANIGGHEVNGLRRHFKYTDEQKGYLAYYFFGMIWLMEFCNALGSFAISYAVVGWYYTEKPKGHNVCGLVTGYLYGLTFHLGSLAFGSLLIAILRYVRIILSILEKEFTAEGNAVAACIAKILICCITCFKKFLEMINKNAYIDICITSNNFCSAAADVMQFFVGHPAEIVILNGACFIFSFAGMAFISGMTSFCTYMLCTSHERWTDETSPHHVASPGFVALVAGVGALFVAHAFMQIFDHTADTLLYTYCWNKSKAHNTVEKYAPSSLAKLTDYKPLERPKDEKAPAGGGGEQKKDCSIQ